MAVYEQSYRRYTGDLTAPSARFLVIPRYAYQRLSGSKILWVLLVVATLGALGTAAFVYVLHNARVLEALHIEVASRFPLDARFFDIYLSIELWVAYLLVLVAGPSLVSMDLANGALPLYFARPLSRAEYVAGKLSVLAVVLSLVTWVYGLGLFALQAVLEGDGWAWHHVRIAAGLFVGSWVWILVMSFLTLALSALIRWPLAVRGVLLVAFLVLPGFGFALSGAIRSDWGHVIDLPVVLGTIVSGLLGVEPEVALPAAGAWCAAGLVLAGSFLLLWKKLRAYEVVS